MLAKVLWFIENTIFTLKDLEATRNFTSCSEGTKIFV